MAGDRSRSTATEPERSFDTGLDEGVSPRLSWLTLRRATLFLLAWLAAFGLGSVAVANPFDSEPSASAAPNYWHVMYLHGLLIGLVGIGALLILDAFELKSPLIRGGIVVGVLASTILAGIGGIFDSRLHRDRIAMWTHTIGYFTFDVIVALMLVGFVLGWRSRAFASRTLPFVCAGLSSLSILIAGVMGHLAGWMLEFGDHPSGIFSSYARFVGESFADLRDNLTVSHSHQMTVAAMALIIAVVGRRFAASTESGTSYRVSQLGMAMVTIGVITMSGVYVAMGSTSWSVPTALSSAHGINGVAVDDGVTGIFVMGGGLLAIWPLMVRSARAGASLVRNPLPLAAAWAWTGVVGGVVLAGYWIELHETFFGAGNASAPGASNDAVFTWLHQDIGLFLLPALVAVMIVADRMVARRYRSIVGWTALTGTTALLLGGGIWVFADPALNGPGYIVSTTGVALVGVSVAVTILSGFIEDGRFRVVPHRRPRAH